MYLHAGRNRVIRTKTIIGIFDTDKATVSGVTRDYLRGVERDGLTESASFEIPKSFILYDDDRVGGVQKVCFSQISTGALVKRIEKSATRERSRS